MRALRREQFAFASALRKQGQPWHAVAELLREEYRLNGRTAMRIAHGWTQAEAAAEWNHRWPDEPKSFKNFSYWETWPNQTGYMPSLATLDRLAELYECNIGDLLDDWGRHRELDRRARPAQPSARPGTALAWQAANLELPELTDAVGKWAAGADAEDQRALLLKLSTAAALSAAQRLDARTSVLGVPETRPSDLAGAWLSRYRYSSTSRGRELEDTHVVELRAEAGRLIGRSSPHDGRSSVELDLDVVGTVATGTWREQTSPSGYYRGARYQGVLQLVVDPSGLTMTGQWLGVSKRFSIKSGSWSLTRELNTELTDSAAPRRGQ